MLDIPGEAGLLDEVSGIGARLVEDVVGGTSAASASAHGSGDLLFGAGGKSSTTVDVVSHAPDSVKQAAEIGDSQPSWCAGSAPHRFGILRGNVDTQLCVIGGGLVGVNQAFEASVPTVLLEAGDVAGGATGHGATLLTDIPDAGRAALVDHQDYGPQWTSEFVRQLRVSQGEVAILARRFGADYIPGTYYMVSHQDGAELLAEYNAARLGDPGMRYIDGHQAASILPGAVRPVQSAIASPGGVLNPIKLTVGMASDVAGRPGSFVFEHSPVRQITFGDPGQPIQVHTDAGTVRARQVLFATHWPVAPFQSDPQITPIQAFASRVEVPAAVRPMGPYSNTEYPSYGYGGVIKVNSDGSATVLSGGGARWLAADAPASSSELLARQTQDAYQGGRVTRLWSYPLAIPEYDGVLRFSRLPADNRIAGSFAPGGIGLTNARLSVRVWASGQPSAHDYIKSLLPSS